MKTIQSIEWRAEQKALKYMESFIRKEVTDRIVQLQIWIEDEEKQTSGTTENQPQEKEK
tara:strand:- start:1797 stop:1973 length:177 start_codon:yes stop_codon:yes gene_type:complete